MANLADLVVRVTSDVKGVQVGMDRTRRDLQKTQAEAEKTGRAFKTSSAVIAAGATAIAAGIGAYALKSRQTFASWGKEIRGIQRLTGATAEQAGKLYAEMKLTSGMTVDTGTALAFLAKNLGAAHLGSGPLYEDLQRLGISMKDANGEWRSAADILPELRDRLAELKDPSDRAKIAADALGRGYKTLLPYLTASADAMRENQRFLRDLGFRVTDKDMAAFAQLMGDEKKFAFAQQYMQFQMGRLVADLENKVMPALIKVATLFNKLPKEVILAVGAFAALVGAIKGVQTVIGILNSAKGMGGLLKGIGGTVTSLPTLIAQLGMTAVAYAGVGAAAAGAAIAVWQAYEAYQKWQDAEQQRTAAETGRAQNLGKAVGSWQQEHAGQPLPAEMQKLVDDFYKDLGDQQAQVDAYKRAVEVYSNGTAQQVEAYRQSIGATMKQATNAADNTTAVVNSTQAAQELTTAVQDNTAVQKEFYEMTAQEVADQNAAKKLTNEELLAISAAAAATLPPSNGPFTAGQTGVKYHEFAGGGAGVTSGPMLALIGEAGPEPYAIGKDHVGRGSVVFKDCTFSARSPRELMELMKRELSREVRYANG